MVIETALAASLVGAAIAAAITWVYTKDVWLTGLAGALGALVGLGPAVLIALAAATAVDLKQLRIPNNVSLLAWCLAALTWYLQGAPLWVLAVAGAIGILGLVLYLAGGLGGGDVKLLPAAALGVLPATEHALIAGSLLLLVMGVVTVTLHYTDPQKSKTQPLAPGIFLGSAAIWTLFSCSAGSMCIT
jgi:Flp pilus assembly protein protease CpaA